jgi:amino acid transporter
MVSVTVNARGSSAGDDAVLESFGYKPQLKRSLRPMALFGIAFSFMSITTSVYTTFGFGLGKFGPASVWVFPITLGGQVLIALVVAELGSRIPLAGYSYQWGARLVSPGYGWLLALTSLLYLLTATASEVYVLIAPFIATMLGWQASPPALLILSFAILVVLAAVNIIGVKLFARINSVAVIAEIIAAFALAVAVAVAYFIKPDHPVTWVFNTGGAHGTIMFGAIVGAMTAGLYTLTGFEAAADMSEEAKGASGNVPRAVLGALLGSGVVGFLGIVGFALAVPNVAKTAASGTPIFDILSYWFGSYVARVLTVFPLIAVLGTVLSILAIQGRLLFALARDNIAPASGYLRKVGRRSETPVTAIVSGTVLAAGVMVYSYFRADVFLILVGATAILPYIIYLMLLNGYLRRRRDLDALRRPGSFSLGRWAVPVAVAAVVWDLIALSIVTVPKEFHQADLVVAAVLIIGVLWNQFFLRHRVRRGQAGASRLPAAESAPAAKQITVRADKQWTDHPAGRPVAAED